ncbi:MAG: hypothetical protein DUD39_05115 [Coriobacteriaceae bacterium]|nr:MAG: hypothetical protein DUD39_05115 [Coriobacteriaceae bacterium]
MTAARRKSEKSASCTPFSRSSAPVVEASTGSTTMFLAWSSSRLLATAAAILPVPSMPIFTAEGTRSSNAAQICCCTSSGTSGVTACTAASDCAVIAVAATLG